MTALTRLVSLAVRWVAGTRRRRVAVLALPVLIAIAAIAPRAHSSTGPRPGVLAGQSGASASGTPGPAGTPTVAASNLNELPATTGAPGGPPAAARPAPRLSPQQVAAAVAYVTTVNTHDARPHRDAGPLDSYRRARPYVTAGLYILITAPSNRGDYQWAQWVAQRAVVSVRVARVAVPDGAPVPTASTADVRVQFSQNVTPHVAGAAPASVDGVASLVVSRQPDGRWLVSRLLANT